MAVEEVAGPSTAGGSGGDVAGKNKKQAENDRRLRSEYRNFAKSINREGDELVLDQGKLRSRLERANALHGQVENPREQAEDVDCFFLLTQKGAEAARRAMGGNRDKTANDLIRALKAVYVTTSNPQEDGANIPTAFNWVTLAKVAGTFFKHAPGISCMLGPMDAAPKVRKVAARQLKKALGALVSAADNQSTEEKEEADKNMEEMCAKLLEDNGKNVLQCVMNHESFSQTVENMFALSFMVRDGRVTMTKAAGGGFKVTALSEEDRKQLARGQPRTQVIFSLNMDTWDTWRRRVRPEDCIMAHRPPAVLPGTAGAPTPPTGKGAAKGGGSARKRAASREPVAQEGSASDPDVSDDEEAARALDVKGKRVMRLS